MDPKDVSDLITSMRSLCEVLDAETRALACGDFATMGGLLAEKNRLVRGYEKLFRSLAAREDFPDGVEEEQREILGELAERLGAATELNGRKLAGMIEANRTLIDTIYQVHSTEQSVPVYAATGKVAGCGPSALAFNQTC